MNYPNGVTTDYIYDEVNRIVNLTATDTTGEVITDFTYSYDNVGNVISMTDTEGVTTYVYGPLYRLTDVSYPDGDTTTYTYDALGNRLTKDYRGMVTKYQYNKANQLVQIWEPAYTEITVQGTIDDPLATVTVNGRKAVVSDGIFTARNIILEPGGNFIEAEALDLASNVGTDSINVTYEVSDVVIDTTFSYDNRGNSIQKNREGEITNYGYDYENRLISANLPGVNASYQYNGDGWRISKAVNGVITKYVYDSNNVIQELDDSNSILASYNYGPIIDEIISQKRDGVLYYYHTNALGTIRSLTDPTGNIAASYTYDAFGELDEQVGNIVNPYRFTGRRRDSETGLYYYQARYYDAVIGRFLQADPIGYSGAEIKGTQYLIIEN